MTEREPRRDELGRATFLAARLTAERMQREVEAECQVDGISEPQYAVLWVLCLSAERQGIPQGAISDGLVTRGSDVSRLVDRLEEAGLVERRRAAVDRRVVLVRPTRRGRQVFERATDRIKSLHRAQWEDLDTAELKLLHSLLNRVLWTGVEQPAENEAS